MAKFSASKRKIYLTQAHAHNMLPISFVWELGRKKKIRVERNGGRMEEGKENYHFNGENYPIWAKFKPQ